MRMVGLFEADRQARLRLVVKFPVERALLVDFKRTAECGDHVDFLVRILVTDFNEMAATECLRSVPGGAKASHR